MVDKIEKYFHGMKKAIRLLVPISVLYFFLAFYPSGSRSSTFSFIFFSSFNIRLPALLFFPLLERKYMFLICNGILAFLANASSFSSFLITSSTSSLNAELVKNIEDAEEEGTEEEAEAAEEVHKEEELEEEEGNEVSVDIEELNKKIEEFIRKMKEEIRTEGQRQLVSA